MKRVCSVAVGLMTLASAAVASADSIAWYSATHADGAGTLPAAGAPGTALNLTCNSSAATTCTWAVTFQVNTVLNSLGGWSGDLHTAPGNGVSTSNPAIGTVFTSVASPGVPGTGASLLLGSRGFTLTPLPPPSNILLLTFTLSRQVNAGDLSAADITFSTNPSDAVVWGNGDTGDYETVAIGPNAPTQGVENHSFALPVIHIQNVVPEPTTLALLALGGVAALRRRRAAR